MTRKKKQQMTQEPKQDTNHQPINGPTTSSYGTTTKTRTKPSPNWFPNLLLLALTVTVVRGVITHIWPGVDLGLDVTRIIFNTIDEIYVSAGLACTLAVTLYIRRKKSRNKKDKTTHSPEYTAHRKVPNPIMNLTPIPTDKEPFQRVVDDEWFEIANARQDRGHSLNDKLRGMCFSGGGIRAASYMAGAMEILEQTRLLPLCDYLSTVSGGGYTGSAFMTRDKEASNTVSRLVRRMTVNSDYLGVSSNEANTIATMDFALSVTAALANNCISVLAYSIVLAEYTNFLLLWRGVKQPDITAFLVGDEINNLKGVFIKWFGMVILGVSIIWIIVFGLYSATASKKGSVPVNFTTRATSKTKRMTRMKARTAPDHLGLHRCESSIIDFEPESTSFPPRAATMSQSLMECDEDTVSDDDKDDHDKDAHDPRERRLQVNHLLSYLCRCLVVLVCAFVSLICLLFIMKYLLSLRQNEESNKVLISVELAAIILFGLARGGSRSDTMASESTRVVLLVLVGLAGVVAVLFIVGRIMLWRILGCSFTACEPETCDVLYGACGCQPSQHLLLGIYIYVLVVEVFIREPLGQALHDMYRRRLVGSFYKNGRDKPFKEIPRRPYFICNVALNNMQDPTTGSRTTHPFFLSKRYCGSPLTGYKTAEYLNTYLSKGMAISGAALSTQFDTFLTAPMKMAMMLMGIDLGEWFRFRRDSPMRHYTVQLVSSLPYILLIFASQLVTSDNQSLSEPQIWLYGTSLTLFVTPVILMVLWGMLLQVFKLKHSNIFLHLPLYRKIYQFFGFLSWRHDPFFYLADGGWFDYYGLYELLRRGNEEIFLFDADADHTNYKELLESLFKAESDLGITVDLSTAGDAFTAAMQNRRGGTTAKSGLIDTNTIHVKLFYPPDEHGFSRACDLWIGKLSLTGEEPPWLKLYALSDDEFPHHSVSNQGFDSRTFRAYRELGRFVADKMIQARNAYIQSSVRRTNFQFPS
eukprot:TRINITY_DN5186_c2_g1_i1.p1 TRINITY_DN5186_c2_g1~~TRINITY_DN5186_c2_g1_i1.p1  ORF type:complete len:1000 (+),score=169.66 TRINITY_DN5186_c2_g1_i1:63-3002(+)